MLCGHCVIVKVAQLDFIKRTADKTPINMLKCDGCLSNVRGGAQSAKTPQIIDNLKLNRGKDCMCMTFARVSVLLADTLGNAIVL